MTHRKKNSNFVVLNFWEIERREGGAAMDAPAAADIFLVEGFRLHRHGGVLFRPDQQGNFAPMAIGRRAPRTFGGGGGRAGGIASRGPIIRSGWAGTQGGKSKLNRQKAAL